MKLEAAIEQALEEAENRSIDPRIRHAPTHPFYNRHQPLKACQSAIANLDGLPRPLKPPGRSS